MKRKNGQIICLDCRQWSSQSDKVNKGKTNVDQKGKKKNTDKNRVEMGRKDHSFLREIDQIKAELYQICKCQKHSKLRSCGGHQSIPPFPVFLLLYFESQDMTSLNCISQYTLPIDFWLG